MFKKLASDALGLSDIGKVIPPEQYGEVDSDDYIMNEENEKIFFLIKSKADEYCFTNLALIHLDGDSAISKKRSLKRYPYKHYHFTDVWLETAGTIDLDIEIKFTLGDTKFSIDVAKKQIDQIKDLYKSLFRIATMQEDDRHYFSYSKEAIESTINSINRTRGDGMKSEDFSQINEYIFDWKVSKHKEFVRADFGEVFDKFIKN